jgi:hypothetical protein
MAADAQARCSVAAGTRDGSDVERRDVADEEIQLARWLCTPCVTMW